MAVFFLGLIAYASSATASDVGPVVRAVWLLQQHGTPDAVDPANDQRVKAVASKAIAKDGVITLPELGGFMTPEEFRKIAGSDEQIDADEVANALETASPASRAKLSPKLKAYAEYLTTSFDMIDAPHREAGRKLAEWIAANDQPGVGLNLIVVCTGNSRRSILGSSLGNLAAAYQGFPEIRFYSGGTAPSAFNPRTVAALEAVGFVVEPTGKEAVRGEPNTPNPIYRVTWGEGLESLEFSKLYGDSSNPSQGFAALMVCSEADAGCPFVKGAKFRLSMPYLDPKIYDQGAYETMKYAERRDDIGRLMLSVMTQARRLIDARRAGHQ